ncbi:sigma-70 family RNA polymerase sigma factor [Actinomadura sp. HBU206391]|uniref:sigma-70 family RNA polymerase sigma factor n=1 Tax=Actinomadura sp. HBU206391 TaxID=2731692 RepID=UPI00164EFB5E|nr:sigma-70 family RNA polymerase sigma factor [Actinomadura sp. HBU206391]MBC6458090.1 sigma-70 family RNA polymerase sigma factor [Actinomadura sp. HBU206391]
MNIVQLAGGGRPAAEDFRTRNNEHFARRKELQEQLTVLRARADAGELDMLSELALRRAERELEDVTYEILNVNFGLVRKYVAMFTSRSNEHIEDFESAGKVGLLWAISSYDPERGPFAGWAFKPIQREVLRAVRDADHPNLNPGDFEKRPAILAAERAFLEEAGPDAPVDHADVARRAGVTEAQVRRVLDAPRLDSLHAPAPGEGEYEVPWDERLADPSPGVEEEVLLRFDLRAVSGRGLSNLAPRERYVLTRRFGLDGEPEQSLRVIGERLGLSREGVRQIQQKALAKLAERIVDGVDGPERLEGRAG